MISTADKELLAEIIVAYIREEFAIKHLSGNLLDSIKVEELNGNVRIIIEAPIYDMFEYLKNKTIIYKGKGSYASQLNEYGSQILNKHTGNHKGYIDEIIMKSIREWKELVQKGVTLKQYGNINYGAGSKI